LLAGARSIAGLLFAALVAALLIGPARADTTWTLTVTITGTGAGTVTSNDGFIDCQSSAPGVACSQAYGDGTPVSLVPSVSAGSYFAGWSGGCSGNAEADFMMTADVTCTAEFDGGGGAQSGATLTVTTGGDDASAFGLGISTPVCYVNFCTLRDALANGDGKTIAFGGGVTTVTLTAGLAVGSPASPVIVDGGSGVTIDAAGAGSAAAFSMSGGTVTLSHVTVANSHGGGISQSAGTLTLQHVTVQDNSKSGGFSEGGGILSHGTITVTDSTISGNTAPVCAGIEMYGTATITDTLITDNHASYAGGGLCVHGGTVTLNGGVVSSNSAPSGGGAGVAGGTLTGGGTVFTGNSATTAGAALLAGQGGAATLANETFTANTSHWAVETDTNPGSSVKLVNATITGNDDGVSGVVTLLNSIVANQGIGGNCNNASSPPPTSLGHNIDSDGTCSLTGTGDRSNVDPLLDAPTVHGFFPLLNGSPALDTGATGTVSGVTVPAKDALGTARPQGGGVDIGAMEMSEHKLAVKTAGTGKGTVTPDAPPATGGWYVAGSTVTLTATPDGTSAFGSWSGACAGTSPVLGVLIGADQTCTASFVLKPVITSFAPATGRIRSTVTITGKGFTGATSLTFGGHDAASFHVASDTKITAVVPDNATTGAIHVTAPGGDFGSAGGFTVKWIAPTIGSFSPAKAGAGATVTLIGTGFFGASAVVFHGNPAATFTVVGDTKITAVVPANSSSTGQITLTTAGGLATSKTSFTFLSAPAISNFTPGHAAFGAVITITGSHFTGTTAVSFNGGAAKFKVASDTQITATVPTTANTGAIAITNGGGATQTAADFTLDWITPVVSSFTPAKGPILSTVTITGSHFTRASSVSIGGHPSPSFKILSDTKITAVVPYNAVTGNVYVGNAGGTGGAPTSFTVTWPVPKITSFSPASGPPGSTVTITGTGLIGATAMSLNGVPILSATFLTTTKVQITVPGGATTGKFSITTPGGTALSSATFTVT